ELKNVVTRIAVLLPADVSLILPIHLVSFFPEHTKFNDVSEYTDADQGIKISQSEHSETKRLTLEEEGVFLPVGTTLEDAETQLINLTLKKVRNNRTKAAKILGIGLRTLRRRLNE